MIISFYTPKYADVVNRLEDSLIRYKLDYCIYDVEDQGSWVKNAGLKPEIILQAMIEFDEPIIWLDADSVVREYPEVILSIKEDFGCHFRDWGLEGRNKVGFELLSGTLFFNNTNNAKDLLLDWYSQQQKQPNEWDQRTLQHVHKTWTGTTFHLPPSYTKIFDSMRYSDAVIEHYQESRKYR